MWSELGTVLLSVCGSSAVAAVVTGRMNRETTSSVEELKAKLDHQRGVSKAQFDAELAAYQEVWQHLSDFVIGVRSFVNAELSPGFISSDPRQAYQAYDKLHDEIVKQNNALAYSSARHTPFVSNEIAQELQAFSSTSSHITAGFMTAKDAPLLSAEWLTNRKRLSEEAHQRSQEIAASIRKRMGDLRVML